MKHILMYPVGTTDACRCAGAYLKQAGFPLTDHPSPEVTHLMLDVPSFAGDGSLRGGGSLPAVLERLPGGVTVIGGNLNHPSLAEHPVVDLLRDEEYLAKNAAITAECALRVAFPLLPTVLTDTPALVIGWGRIGKCLTKLLSAIGCPVTVAARNPADRAMAAALGWNAVEISKIPEILPDIHLLLNTAPAPILGANILDKYRKCAKIDLASRPGLEGCGIVYARGLPGQYAPESSGALIAERILRYLREETL
ncbi:MAG: hypothetical protein Q4F81_06180 [Eubacteriales bacterium]|nr:hypothetical protein [Eubacteriales bacterium]